MKWIKRLFCDHHWRTPWLVPAKHVSLWRIGLKSWECDRCGKFIARPTEWVPMNRVERITQFLFGEENWHP